MVELLLRWFYRLIHSVNCTNCSRPLPDNAESDLCSDECEEEWAFRVSW